jgi:hypothetical protein
MSGELSDQLRSLRSSHPCPGFAIRATRFVSSQRLLASRSAQSDIDAGAIGDLRRIGMSGHSFGAQTNQAVCGQSAGIVGSRLSDQPIKAAIAFSPSSPRRGRG